MAFFSSFTRNQDNKNRVIFILRGVAYVSLLISIVGFLMWFVTESTTGYRYAVLAYSSLAMFILVLLLVGKLRTSWGMITPEEIKKQAVQERNQKAASEMPAREFLTSMYWILLKYGIKALSYITRYFPFSLLFQNRLFHASYQPFMHMIEVIEKIARNNGTPLTIQMSQSEIVDPFVYFRSELPLKKKNLKEKLQRLESRLQKRFGSVYMRVEGTSITVLVPVSQLDAIK